MASILNEDFFARRPQMVAKELLGKFLVRKTGSGIVAVMITETEAYDGTRDLACHARSGKTARNAPMWGPPGHAYVYFTYGMHWLLNLVTGEEGYPSAVLIRRAGEYVGPARLTKALSIDRSLNAIKLVRASGLWVEDRGIIVDARDVRRTPRVGVEYAGEWALKPWRYVIERETQRLPSPRRHPRSRRAPSSPRR